MFDDQLVIHPNHFTQHFLKAAYANNTENYVVCPIGALFLLTALLGSNGIRQNTAKQVATNLGIRTSNSTLRTKIAKMSYVHFRASLGNERTIIQRSEVKVINVSTGVFLKTNYKFQKEFKDIIRDEFMCKVENLDFTNQLRSVGLINSWIKYKTGGLIDNFFKNKYELPANTRIALINTVTFKDVWKKKFDMAHVHSGRFYLSKSKSMVTEFMRSDETVNYGRFKLSGFRMISKQFENTRFSFVAVLPTIKFNLTNTLQFLTGRRSLFLYIDKLKPRSVTIKLPKFKLEKSLDLIEILKVMGISDMFDGIKANLTGITETERLKVDFLRQTTLLKVDEKGVEAAAATAIYSLGRSLHYVPTNAYFIADHPFVCFIYDNLLKVPLYAALVKTPLPPTDNIEITSY
ncbi:Glia-derived nexin [Schistosoma japonicum]|uniref:Glia-derived nexin n=1 Tax=Schistosoma japonicum TaxID=6182 RepID=A0A4Z2CRL6_SCHJA|nr:Glia-derived nexin [Schistosoma japonicum]